MYNDEDIIDALKGVNTQNFIKQNSILESIKFDMRRKNYSRWVESFPTCIHSIFSYLFYYSEQDITIEDVKYFQNHGLEINEFSNLYFRGDKYINPLIMACQCCDIKLMKVLISCGADVNMKHEDLSPLTELLSGNIIFYKSDPSKIREGLKLLQNHGIKKVLPSSIERYIKYYDNDVKRFYKSCMIIGNADHWRDYEL